MLKEAAACGLAIDDEFASNYGGYAQDRLYRSESYFYRTFDWLRRRAGRGERDLIDRPQSANLALDPSVIWRINADPEENVGGKLRHAELGGKKYRPQNVLRFLKRQPDLDAYIASLGIDPGKLPDDVRERLRSG